MKRVKDVDNATWMHGMDIVAFHEDGDVFGSIFLIGLKDTKLARRHAYGDVYDTEFGYGVRLMRDGGYHYGAVEANAAYGLFRYRWQAEAMAKAVNDAREL